MNQSRKTEIVEEVAFIAANKFFEATANGEDFVKIDRITLAALLANIYEKGYNRGTQK